MEQEERCTKMKTHSIPNLYIQFNFLKSTNLCIYQTCAFKMHFALLTKESSSRPAAIIFPARSRDKWQITAVVAEKELCAET